MAAAPPGWDQVRDLFRERDREEMLYAFDLWSRDDVAEYAEPILERLEDGTMPCDDPWPEEKVQLLRRWFEAGCPA